jgi:uncharacterized protein YyaL (SSP411 family)
LASAHRITGEARSLRAAADAAGFVLGTMIAPDGRLRHVSIGGEARVPAFLDDHAFLVKGLIALYEAGFDPAHLEQALELTERAWELFWDDAGGGFYADAAAEVGARRKEIYDGAVPSGNSVMLANLLRLGRLTGRPGLEERAARLSEAFAGSVALHPPSHAAFLCGLDFALGPSRELVVVGKPERRETKELLEAAGGAFYPHMVFLFKPSDEPGTAGRLERLAPFTKGMDAGGGIAAAYVCSGGSCLRPVTTAAGLREALG